MKDKQTSGKDPNEIFKEIDALCEEVGGSTSIGKLEEENINPVQSVIQSRENKEREKRKNYYFQLLP